MYNFAVHLRMGAGLYCERIFLGGRKMDNMMQALILLLAGFLVVFSVLVLLIAIVTIYSKIIRTVQNAGKKKKEIRSADESVKLEKPDLRAVTREEIEDTDGEIPPEIIAVIAAAVDAMYGEKPHRIKAVKRSRSSRSAWSRAGALQNTRPF